MQFFFLFENIVDSPLNQSRNTTGIPAKNVNYLHFKRKVHTVIDQVKEQKKKKKKLFTPNEYRRFADFPQTLGIKPSKRNIQRTTLASPRKVCVMQSCAKLLGFVMLYPETFFHHIEQSA